jgi:hypothetical protein
MTNSDSMHFSDKLSYNTLFISNYGLEDMNFARYKHLQEFSENRNFAGTFLTEEHIATGTDCGSRALMRLLTGLLTKRWCGRAGLPSPDGKRAWGNDRRDPAPAVRTEKQMTKKKTGIFTSPEFEHKT